MPVIVAFLMLFGVAIPTTIDAQQPPVTLPGTEVRPFHSDILNQDLELYVKLPWSYGEGDREYRVLFCLDGNRSFPLWSTMSLILETPGSGAEETVIVGIGYRVDENRLLGLADWATWRTRDLTPVRRLAREEAWEERLNGIPGREGTDVQTGGAPEFLESIQREIIPFIESNYRVSSGERGLAGASLGGLFTLYALFHAHGTFGRYFAASPTMWEELFQYEQAFATDHQDLPVKLFLTASSMESERTIEGMQRLADRLRAQEYPGLKLETYVFDGETHSSGYAAAVSRALRVLYGGE